MNVKLLVSMVLFILTGLVLAGSLWMAMDNKPNWGWFLFVGFCFFLVSASTAQQIPDKKE